MLKGMTMRPPILAAAFSGLAALSGVALGQVVVLPLASTRISGISDDGTRVSGPIFGNRQDYYSWDATGGYTYANVTPSDQHGEPYLSGAGNAIAGSRLINGTQRAFVSTNGGAPADLPFSLPGQVNQSIPTGTSRDGSVVCGWDTHFSNPTQVGWRWSATSGMQVLPGFAFTLSMSGDGRTIFGGNGAGQYGMWRDGVVSPVPNNFGRVQAVNYDASILAGDGRIWRDGQITTLPLLPGAGNPEIIDISEDGNVVVGTNSLFGGGDVPIIWTPATGTQRLGDYFASFGYDLSGYQIVDAHLNATGRTFGLSAWSPNEGAYRSLIVTVPGPGAGLLVGVLAVRWTRRRRN